MCFVVDRTAQGAILRACKFSRRADRPHLVYTTGFSVRLRAHLLDPGTGLMDFGKRHNLAGVDFGLPAISQATRTVLGRAGGPGSVFFGAPAWARRDWIGKLFPKGTPSRQFLALYAQQATAIELNATFYNLPSEDVIAGWAAQTPEQFRFCPKLHQAISHDRGLLGVTAAAGRFCARFAGLGPRLGPFFLQLPPWFDINRRRVLLDFAAGFPKDQRLQVEFRHESWFAAGDLDIDVARGLEDLGVGTVITDVAGRRDVSHGRLTSGTAMVRFVGNQHDETDLPRTDAWVRRLAAWREAGLGEAYFFIHQPDDLEAPELMAAFTARGQAAGLPLTRLELESEKGQLSLL